MSALPSRSVLTREGRDTLWLLAVLALTIAPHVGRLPVWCLAGTAGAIGWRAWIAWRDAALPPRWVLLLALAISVGATLLTFQSLLGRAAGVTLVTLLAGLKTLELRARRDAFVVTSLGFFLILTQFLHDQGPLNALLMTVALLGLLTSLVLAQRPLGRPPLREAMGEAGRALLWGLPLAVVLYLFFPRFGPLWSLPNDAGARTGLSEQMELGHVAELAQDDTIAMRVRFEGEPPPPRALYFRGPVLDLFDGQTWRSLPSEAPQRWRPSMGPAADARAAWTYSITLEALSLPTLPLLEGTANARITSPATLPQPRRLGMEWSLGRAPKDRITVAAQARPAWRPLLDDDDPMLRTWLALPAGHASQTVAWAQALRGRPELQQAGVPARVQAVLRHIRTGGYSYTLAPGVDEPDAAGRLPDPVDTFWLNRRAGFCEHFAAAFVVVMRAMDVPARVVTGFQGAERNPVDGLYEVRNRDAHAWAEIWWPGRGWTRVDPTAAVAPDRVERPRRLLNTPVGQAGPLATMAPDWVRQARAAMDAARHRWNMWVQGYDRQKQFDLLKNAGWDAPDSTDLLRLAGLALAVGSLAGVAWMLWQHPTRRASAWQHTLQQLASNLARAGLHPPAGSPAAPSPLTWASLVEATLQAPRQTSESERAAAGALAERLRALDASHYGATPQRPARLRLEQRALRRLIRQWRDSRRNAPRHGGTGAPR